MDTYEEKAGETREERNTRLFNRLVKPRMGFVRSLVCHYATTGLDTDSAYSIVLEKLFRHIHTYKEDMSLDTWLHTIVKRRVGTLNKYYYEHELAHRTGIPYEDVLRAADAPREESGRLPILNNIPDSVRNVLLTLPEHKLRVLLLQFQGYSIKEITAIENSRSRYGEVRESSVKWAIVSAKKYLREKLRDYGKNRR